MSVGYCLECGFTGDDDSEVCPECGGEFISHHSSSDDGNCPACGSDDVKETNVQGDLMYKCNSCGEEFF